MLLDINTNNTKVLDESIGTLSTEDFMLWLVLNKIHYYNRCEKTFSQEEAIAETAKKGLSTVYIKKSKAN